MLIIGVDEAGRGAWAGPLVAAAVALKQDVPGLNDSKLLTPAGRQAFYDVIMARASVGIGLVEPADIDARGLSWAQARSMGVAMKQAAAGTHQPDIEIIIDGSIDYLKLPNSRAVIKADSSVPSVMAASIVAKVYRDKLMSQLERDFPGYGFAAHKGYGTRAHSQALKDLGVCLIHRRSYKPVATLL